MLVPLVVVVVVVLMVVVAVIVIVVVIAVVMVVIGVIVVVLFIFTHDECTIDGIAVLVDDLDVLEQPVERLGLADLGDQVGHRVVLLVGLANLGRLLADLHPDPGVLGIEVLVGHLAPFGNTDGAQRQVDLHGLLGLDLQALDERRRVLSGDLQPLI